MDSMNEAEKALFEQYKRRCKFSTLTKVIESTSKAMKATPTLNKMDRSHDANINSSRLSKRTPDKTLTPVMLRNEGSVSKSAKKQICFEGKSVSGRRKQSVKNFSVLLANQPPAHQHRLSHQVFNNETPIVHKPD
jgi:hypothetical protein